MCKEYDSAMSTVYQPKQNYLRGNNKMKPLKYVKTQHIFQNIYKTSLHNANITCAKPGTDKRIQFTHNQM